MAIKLNKSVNKSESKCIRVFLRLSKKKKFHQKVLRRGKETRKKKGARHRLMKGSN